MQEAIRNAFAVIALIALIPALILLLVFFLWPSQELLVSLIEAVAVPWWVKLSPGFIVILLLLAAWAGAEDALV